MPCKVISLLFRVVYPSASFTPKAAKGYMRRDQQRSLPNLGLKRLTGDKHVSSRGMISCYLTRTHVEEDRRFQRFLVRNPPQTSFARFRRESFARGGTVSREEKGTLKAQRGRFSVAHLTSTVFLTTSLPGVWWSLPSHQ